MVMIFSDPRARAQLLGEGLVYTFRKNRRKKVGKNWANGGYRNHKICDIFIEELGEKKVNELEPYVDHSGFDSLPHWYGAIVELNGGWDIKKTGWLYRVRRSNGSETE